MSVPDSTKPRKDPLALTGWTAVPNALLRTERLTLQQKGLLAILLSHCNARRDGEMRCWPGNATLAREANCSIGHVRRLLISLESKKAICRENTSHEGGARRQFTFPSVGINHLPGVEG